MQPLLVATLLHHGLWACPILRLWFLRSPRLLSALLIVLQAGIPTPAAALRVVVLAVHLAAVAVATTDSCRHCQVVPLQRLTLLLPRQR